jgi:hypothetical protein
MTLAEVEAILGGPARDESTGPRLGKGGCAGGAALQIATTRDAAELRRLRQQPRRVWNSDSLCVTLYFAEDGRLAHGYATVPSNAPPAAPLLGNLLGGLRRRLGL